MKPVPLVITLLLMLLHGVAVTSEEEILISLRAALASPSVVVAPLTEVPLARAPIPRFWSLQPRGAETPATIFPGISAALRDPETAQFTGDLQAQLQADDPVRVVHPPLLVTVVRVVRHQTSGWCAARVRVRGDASPATTVVPIRVRDKDGHFLNPRLRALSGDGLTQNPVLVPTDQDLQWNVIWIPGGSVTMPTTTRAPAEARLVAGGTRFVWTAALDDHTVDAAYADLRTAIRTALPSHITPRVLLKDPLIQLLHGRHLDGHTALHILLLSDTATDLPIEAFATPLLQALESRSATSGGWIHLTAGKPVTIDLLLHTQAHP